MDKPKKILLLTHEFLPFRGGVSTYCVELATAAAQLGHDVTVMAPSYPGHDAKSDSSLPFRVERFAFKAGHMARMLYLLWVCFKIKTDKYDIIHAADWMFVVALHTLWPLKKIPFAATVHGTDIYILDGLNLVTKLRGKKFFEHATRIACNSAYTAKLAKQYHPYIPDSKLMVTYLGVNPWWFDAIDPAATLQKYNIPAGKKILLTVARLDVRKGHMATLKALTLLPADLKDQLVYVIVGKTTDPDYQAKLVEESKNTGLPVIFTGAIDGDDVKSFYRAAWMHCMLGEKHPQKVEGFGLSYLEAAAQELPSLATPVGGIPEVVVNEKTGVIMMDSSPQAVAQALEHLLRHPENIAALKGNTRAWASGFTWAKCADETYRGL